LEKRAYFLVFESAAIAIRRLKARFIPEFSNDL
jgi:hypothetical protein